ncbi:hypothetical protein [Luteimonas lutimaris]|uniref:Secreted protein n=1 Tax=Luteimonas lutimaris TaxID=698645 RepID=A0ABP7M8W2_9GAMM
MSIRFALFLLLLCASLPLAAAHEVRMLSAAGDGGGSCADTTTAQDDDRAHPATPEAGSATHTAKPVKTRPAAVRHTGDVDVRPPRWHSFLPGMFR